VNFPVLDRFNNSTQNQKPAQTLSASEGTINLNKYKDRLCPTPLLIYRKILQSFIHSDIKKKI
jgi:hypothetical protein